MPQPLQIFGVGREGEERLKRGLAHHQGTVPMRIRGADEPCAAASLKHDLTARGREFGQGVFGIKLIGRRAAETTGEQGAGGGVGRAQTGHAHAPSQRRER